MSLTRSKGALDTASQAYRAAIGRGGSRRPHRVSPRTFPGLPKKRTAQESTTRWRGILALPEHPVKTLRTWLPGPKGSLVLATASGLVLLYAYDRRECRRIRADQIGQVCHLARQSNKPWQSVRKVTVYTAVAPGDGVENWDKGLKVFKKFVKPILVAAAVDFEIFGGKRHGAVSDRVEERARSEREAVQGARGEDSDLMIDESDRQSTFWSRILQKIVPPRDPPRPTSNPPPDSFYAGETVTTADSWTTATIVMGRHTYKEYLHGLHAGWLSLPVSDTLETEDPVTLDNAPAAISASVPGNGDEDESTNHHAGLSAYPGTIPLQPPLLVVPQNNLVGMRTVPRRFWRWINRRHVMREKGQQAIDLILGPQRPFRLASASSSGPTDAGLVVNSPLETCPVDDESKVRWLKEAGPSTCPAHKGEETSTSSGANDLSKERVISSIPRIRKESSASAAAAAADADTAEKNWVYPSPAQFFAAMARKNHDPKHEDMNVVVPIHNAVNEKAWQEILDWERGRGGQACGGPGLVNFQGRPKDLSPKARLKTFLGYSAPFDRHDWIVDRCGRQIRYVIDFYTGRASSRGGPMSFYLDVRPALDSFEAVKMRCQMFWQRHFTATKVDCEAGLEDIVQAKGPEIIDRSGLLNVSSAPWTPHRARMIVPLVEDEKTVEAFVRHADEIAQIGIVPSSTPCSGDLDLAFAEEARYTPTMRNNRKILDLIQKDRKGYLKAFSERLLKARSSRDDTVATSGDGGEVELWEERRTKEKDWREQERGYRIVLGQIAQDERILTALRVFDGEHHY